MQRSLQQFGAVVAGKLAPGGHDAQLSDRLHTLANRFDLLLGEFWRAGR
jgi:hypothetical protein